MMVHIIIMKYIQGHLSRVYFTRKIAFDLFECQKLLLFIKHETRWSRVVVCSSPTNHPHGIHALPQEEKGEFVCFFIIKMYVFFLRLSIRVFVCGGCLSERKINAHLFGGPISAWSQGRAGHRAHRAEDEGYGAT